MIDITNLIQTTAEFSFAVAVTAETQKDGRWTTESPIAAVLAGSCRCALWINTKAVTCKGPRHMPELKNQDRMSAIEAVN